MRKNIKLGNSLKYFLITSIILHLNCFSFAEEKVTSSPLVNVEKIKPSFEEPSEEVENYTPIENLKEKNTKASKKSYHATLIV